MKLSKLLNRKRKQRKSHQSILNSLKNKKMSPVFSGEIVDITPTKDVIKKPKAPDIDLDEYKKIPQKTNKPQISEQKVVVKENKSNPSEKIINHNSIKVVGGKDTLVKEFLTNNIKTILEKNKVVPVLTKEGQKVIETSKVKDFIEKRQNNVLVSYEYGGNPITPRPGGSLALVGDGADPEQIVPVSQSNSTSNKVINQNNTTNPIQPNTSSVKVMNNTAQSTINQTSPTTNNSSLNFVNENSSTNITPTNQNLTITENRTSNDLTSSVGAMKSSAMSPTSEAYKLKSINRRKEMPRDMNISRDTSNSSSVEVKPTNVSRSSFNSFLSQTNVSLPTWRIRNG